MAAVTVNEEKCKGCGLCETVCPKKIIKRSESKINSGGMNPATVTDPSICIGCAFCAMICPDVCIVVEK